MLSLFLHVGAPDTCVYVRICMHMGGLFKCLLFYVLLTFFKIFFNLKLFLLDRGMSADFHSRHLLTPVMSVLGLQDEQ